MGNLIDLAGKKYGRLVVIRLADNRNYDGKVLWICQCACGVEKEVVAQYLTSGDTKSCGCLLKESRQKHNQSRTRLYRRWADMLSRCRNPRSNNYKYYGARGVTVCADWTKFEAFRDWAMDNGYRDDLTIERNNVNGNYDPGNCRWATDEEQDQNTRHAVRVEINGKEYRIKELSEITNISIVGVGQRIKNGETSEKLLLPSHRGIKA